jgi:acetyl-CoA acetyltransferase
MEDFKNRFAIVGLGVTHVGHCPGKTPRQLEAEAGRLAIEDCGVNPQEIGAAIQCLTDPGGGIRERYDDSYARILGLPTKVYFSSVGRGGETAIMAILIATQLLNLGLAKYVLVSGARDDWNRTHRTADRKIRGKSYIEKVGTWGRPFGDIRAVGSHSFFAARHMYEYGTTSEQLGHVAVSARKWACLNPNAYMYGRPMTIEDHQDSPMVVWPYHLLDICLVSDGGTAFVVTTADRSKDLRRPPVYIMGLGFGEQMQELWWEKKNYTTLAVETAKEDAFRMAGITLKDIDFAEIYDCFTAEVVFALEDYGWCGKGEGGPFVAEGHIAPGGDVPVNTGGGLMSSHHLGNLTGLGEAVMQLRGEGGARQVKDPEIGLVTGHGGEIISGQMCSIHSTLILGR